MSKPHAPALTAVILLTSVAPVSARRRARARHASPPHAAREPAQSSDWHGAYEFAEGGGRAGGMAMIVTHALSVRKRDDSLVCDLDADGYQTSTRLGCAAREESGRLNVYFDSYREGNTFERFRKGQLLLSLEKTVVSGKPRLLTYWGAYQPALKDLPGGRVYFKKIK